MSSVRDSIAAIDNARALLETFAANGWDSAVIRLGDSEFAFSRTDLLGRPETVEGPVGSSVAAAAPAVQAAHSVTAPHVGTVVSVAAPGTELAGGAVAAVLSVLDETVDVLTAQPGRVVSVGVKPGDLAEFGTVLAQLAC